MLTEDENLRVRMGDVSELKKTEVVEFYTHVKYFEDRMEAQMEKIKNANKNG